MAAQVPQTEAIFANSKRTQMEISKALANLGFGAWNELEPGKISDGSPSMPTRMANVVANHNNLLTQ